MLLRRPLSKRASTIASPNDLGGARRRAALPQILAHVLDRVAQQLRHSLLGEIRKAVADRFENAFVLKQSVVLDAGGSLPAEPERTFQRNVDQTAERRQETVFRRFENCHVEIE